MPVTLSIKNAPDEVVAKLKARAARNHRSLQGELMAIVTEAVERSPSARLDDFWNFAKEIGLESPNEAVEIVREMRDSRNK
ncbi:FitA-like ribbon-helix-helix domain-containing protein [Methylocystis hirsuta]|nr:Arc family DNA-binding protein [Methylocystis hirsuta]MBI5011351.1 Arc family DNA-binding protein [Methylocystis sp.]MBI5313849.1 Arc family DNA-binding protein [Methylocystis sp.]